MSSNGLIILGSQPYESGLSDLYQYKVFPQGYKVLPNKYSSYWYINNRHVGCISGQELLDDPSAIKDSILCVEIIGYTPEARTSSYQKGSDLPYVNGCASKQLVAPNRLGDPTWQYLSIPPGSMEQNHHIHSTARVVYVLSGEGTSIVGMPSVQQEYKLQAGMVLILPKMVPHHFTAGDEGLAVIPLHIFSSTQLEHNHPMMAGTHAV